MTSVAISYSFAKHSAYSMGVYLLQDLYAGVTHA